MDKESPITISDSVVMGDIQQNITNVEQHMSPGIICPRCDATNVRIMRCSTQDCNNDFCELCHPICKWTEYGADRFDCDYGRGPFCGYCMDRQIDDWEQQDADAATYDQLRQNYIAEGIFSAIGMIITVYLLIKSIQIYDSDCLKLWGVVALIEIAMIIKFRFSRRAYLEFIEGG